MNKKRNPPPVLADITKFRNKEEREIALQKAHALWFKEDQALSKRKFLHIDAHMLTYLMQREALILAAEAPENEGIEQAPIHPPARPA